MLWSQRYANWRRGNHCRLRKCRQLKNHTLQSLDGMGVEAKQIKQGAAPSRGEEKSTFFSFRCPHSPPSEIRQAWSQFTAARSYWGLLLSPDGVDQQTLCRSEMRQSHVITENEENKIGWKVAMLFRAALQAFVYLPPKQHKHGSLSATGIISEGGYVHHAQHRFVGHRPGTMNRSGWSSQVCPVKKQPKTCPRLYNTNTAARQVDANMPRPR